MYIESIYIHVTGNTDVICRQRQNINHLIINNNAYFLYANQLQSL